MAGASDLSRAFAYFSAKPQRGLPGSLRVAEDKSKDVAQANGRVPTEEPLVQEQR